MDQSIHIQILKVLIGTKHSGGVFSGLPHSVFWSVIGGNYEVWVIILVY